MTPTTIIGDGPAGLACAITLGSLGHSVRVCRAAAPQQASRIESLIGQGVDLLRGLGVCPTAAGAQRMLATERIWGADSVQRQDAISMLPPPWCVDRAALHEVLTRRAVALPSITWATAARSLRWQDHGFHVETDDDGWHTSFVVDATGRARWVARQLDHRTQPDSPLCARIRWFDDEQASRILYVESFREGWCYSIGHGDRTMVAMLSDQIRQVDMDSVLARSERLNRFANVPAAEERVEPAWSGVAATHGPGWLAAGDAAMRVDPIAGQGLFNALATGVDAATTCVGGGGGTAAYAQRIAALRTFDAHHRRMAYTSEHRFARHRFWTARRPMT